MTVPRHVIALSQFESGHPQACSPSLSASADWRSTARRNDLFLIPTTSTVNRVRRRGGEDWETVATTTAKSFRGTGVLDMARALREGRPHRAQGALAYHVLDTMIAIAESVESRAFVDVASSVDKPPLLPEDWDPLTRTV